jgi:hypothetical protein
MMQKMFSYGGILLLAGADSLGTEQSLPTYEVHSHENLS